MAAGRGRGGREAYAPGASREGASKEGCGNFLQHEIYKNSISSIEAGMGMEEQIMCIEQLIHILDVISSVSVSYTHLTLPTKRIV